LRHPTLRCQRDTATSRQHSAATIAALRCGGAEPHPRRLAALTAWPCINDQRCQAPCPPSEQPRQESRSRRALDRSDCISPTAASASEPSYSRPQGCGEDSTVECLEPRPPALRFLDPPHRPRRKSNSFTSLAPGATRDKPQSTEVYDPPTTRSCLLRIRGSARRPVRHPWRRTSSACSSRTYPTITWE